MFLHKLYAKESGFNAISIFKKGRLPAKFKKINNITRAADTITAQILNANNSQMYEANIKKWRNNFERESPYDSNMQYYDLSVNGSKYMIKQEEMKIPLASLEHPLCLMLSSASDMEGLSLLNSNSHGKYTHMLFMGIAPWNIDDGKGTPRYSKLSYDLMRYSMLIALEAESPAFSAMFMSARGKRFILKLLGRIPVDDYGVIYIDVNKTGVEAFIAGKMDIFKANASIR